MDPSEQHPPPARAPLRLAAGVMIGRYRIQEFRGRGGMGEVYLAEDTTLHRPVALKRVAERPGDRVSRRSQILREARRAGRLSDPRIAAVHDVVEHGDEIFLVMEFIDGISVRERMTEQIPLDDFWDLAIECTQALEVAHRHGIVHLDVKPDNIMVTTAGQVKILDFGIARRVFARETETTTLMDPEELRIAGTPAYMPPEAHLGRELDERTDIYSLGVVFYELLAGRRPFLAGDRAGLVNQILHSDPEPLQAVRNDVPPALSLLVARMMAKGPADRPASTIEVLEQLLAIRRGETVPATHPGLAVTRRSRRLTLTVLGALILVAASILTTSAGGKRLLVRWGLRGLPEIKNLVVLPFAVTGEEAEKAAFSLGLAEAMTSALTRASDVVPLQVIPTTETRAEMTEILAEKNGRVDRDVTSLARAKLGANLVLAGTLEKNGDSLQVVMDVREAATAGTLRHAEVRTSLERFSDFMGRVVELLGFSSVDSTGEPLCAGVGRPGSFYLRGWGELLSAEKPADLDRAIKDFELAVSVDPENVAATTGLSRAYLAMSRFSDAPRWLDLAVAKARDAVALDPNHAEAHEALGLALARTEDVDGSRQALRRATQLDPTDDVALYEYARSYGRRKDYRTEDSLFDAAVFRRPDYWRTYWWLATSLCKQGRLDEAIVPFRKMAELAPDLYKSYTNLGAIYLSRGEYGRAVEACRQSARLNPAFSAYSNLATAYFYSRRFGDAVANYRKALELNFDNYAGWLNLGDAYYWGYGKPAEAERAYRTAMKLGEKELENRPYDGALLADLATIQPKLSQPDSARSWIQRAVRDNQNNPLVLYDAALTYWQLGETGPALDFLNRAVASGYPPGLIRDSVIFDPWRKEPRFGALFASPEHSPGSDSIDTQEVHHGKQS